MKTRRILLAVVVLAVVAVLLLVFGKPRSSSRDVDYRVGTLVVPGFVPKEARLIEITKSGSDSVRVRKTGEGWTVESAWGYAAETSRIENLLRAIEELRVRDVRSTRPANHPEFQVDAAEGVWVRVYDRDDNVLASVCAGKAISYDRCFVRTSDSNDVVEATPNLLQDLGAGGPDREPRQTFFVNMKVLSFEANDVCRITLERGDEAVILEKIEVEEPGVNPETGEAETRTVTKWMIRQPDDEEADEAACLSIANGLSGIMATDIGGGKTVEECGLALAHARVTVEFDEESETAPVIIYFGERAPGQNRHYIVTGEPGACIFLVSSYYWDLAVKDLNKLRKVKREEPAEESDEAGEDAGETGEVSEGASEDEETTPDIRVAWTAVSPPG